MLVDGDVQVWESLAILEYLAEKFPDAGLWPKPMPRRARMPASSPLKCMAGFIPLRRLSADEHVAAGASSAN